MAIDKELEQEFFDNLEENLSKADVVFKANANWDEVDKQELAKSVLLLDLFTKTYCRYINDYERFDDLKFRCSECPFQTDDETCLVKSFKSKYAPDYKDFGCMGDL